MVARCSVVRNITSDLGGFSRWCRLPWTQAGRFFEDVQQRLRAEHPVAASIADLLHDSQPKETTKRRRGSVVGDAELGLSLAHGDERIRGEQVEQPQRDARSGAVHALPPLVELLVDPFGTAERVFALPRDAVEEIQQPVFPRAAAEAARRAA